MAAPRLQRTPSIEQRERFVEHDKTVFQANTAHVQTGPLDDALLKRKRQNQKRRFKPKQKIQMTVERINPAKIIKANVAKTRRGGKRKRHKTRKRRKRKRKRRKHFKGGLFERPGVGIKTGQIVRIRTKNSTNDPKTWDPCWKVSLMMNRAAQVDKPPVYDKDVRYENIKPQGILSKQKCKKISGGKRRKTRRRKKHRHRHKRRTHKK